MVILVENEVLYDLEQYKCVPKTVLTWVTVSFRGRVGLELGFTFALATLNKFLEYFEHHFDNSPKLFLWTLI